VKTLPAFASFERGLRDDELAKARRELERLGIEPPAPAEKRGAGRRKKSSSAPAPEPQTMIGIQPDLAGQIDQIAAALDLTRLQLARVILGAGAEALVRELEATGKIVLPLRLDVGKDGAGYYYQHVRTVTPERFENLRHRCAGRLEKWKLWRNPNDATGTPMPPPKAKHLILPKP
jgi:hypothetical protein